MRNYLLAALLGLQIVPGTPFGGGSGGAPSYPLLAPDGTFSANSYSFASNPDSGMYYTSGVRVQVDGGFFGTGPFLDLPVAGGFRLDGGSQSTAPSTSLIIGQSSTGTGVGGLLSLVGGSAGANSNGGDVQLSGGGPSGSGVRGAVILGGVAGTNLKFDRTVTGAGTTGAQTINKMAGCVNFAAAATSLVVTNSLATATSIILATAQANDGTCSVKDIERAAGSFTIRMNAACTAETAVCFLASN